MSLLAKIGRPRWQVRTITLEDARDEAGDVGWAAGLFEGEGCIGTRSNQGPTHVGTARGLRRGYPYLVVTSTDMDVLERFREIVGVGRIYERKHHSPLSKKPIAYWQVGARDDVVTVLGLLWPYLGERRRAKALEVLRLVEVEVL